MAAPETRLAKDTRRPGSGKRASKKERNRDAILRAAAQLFSRKGFHHTTTKEITRKAGIAEGTLFNYFPTKEDLALSFFEQETVKLIEWFRRNKRLQRARLPEKLFAIIHHHLEQLSPYEDFVGAVCLRALQPASKFSPLSVQSQELNLRYLRFISEVLAKAEADREIQGLGNIGPYIVGVFHMAVILYWLQDTSPGKEDTLALLDRCLKVATRVLRKGGWEW